MWRKFKQDLKEGSSHMMQGSSGGTCFAAKRPYCVPRTWNTVDKTWWTATPYSKALRSNADKAACKFKVVKCKK